MKNVLLKISIAVIAAFVFVGGGLFVNAQDVSPEQNIPVEPIMYTQGFDEGVNYYGNIRDVSRQNENFDQALMDHVLPGYLAGFAGLGIVVAILGLLLLAFWIWMLVHAIRHDIDYKPVWILVLWFLNIFGAIIYYFAVKRQCPCCQTYENVCVCGEDGVCKCGTVNSDDLKEIKEDLKN